MHKAYIRHVLKNRQEEDKNGKKREETEEVEEIQNKSRKTHVDDESPPGVSSLIGVRFPDAGGRAGGVEAFRLAGDEG